MASIVEEQKSEFRVVRADGTIVGTYSNRGTAERIRKQTEDAEIERATPAGAKIDTLLRSIFPDVETFDTRNSDDLDFHDVSVWQLRTIAERAFAAGRDFQAKKSPFTSLERTVIVENFEDRLKDGDTQLDPVFRSIIRKVDR